MSRSLHIPLSHEEQPSLTWLNDWIILKMDEDLVFWMIAFQLIYVHELGGGTLDDLDDLSLIQSVDERLLISNYVWSDLHDGDQI